MLFELPYLSATELFFHLCPWNIDISFYYRVDFLSVQCKSDEVATTMLVSIWDKINIPAQWGETTGLWGT